MLEEELVLEEKTMETERAGTEKLEVQLPQSKTQQAAPRAAVFSAQQINVPAAHRRWHCVRRSSVCTGKMTVYVYHTFSTYSTAKLL